MDKDALGDLEGKPHFRFVPRDLQRELDALDVKCREQGIVPVAFIALVPEQGLFFAPMASMSDAEGKSLTERVLPVVVDALRASDDDWKKKLM